MKKNKKTMEITKQQFEQLVEENKETIYTVCYMFSDNEADVADLFQETLINLWKGCPKIEWQNVKGWVYRVCFNTCISQERKARRHRHVRLTMDVSPFDDTDNRMRQISLLHERIGKLQPFDRAIVLLWLENMTYDEIGLILGISAKNVSVRLVRIKEQLKKM